MTIDANAWLVADRRLCKVRVSCRPTDARACARDLLSRDRDETDTLRICPRRNWDETLVGYDSRPSRDWDVETETTSLCRRSRSQIPLEWACRLFKQYRHCEMVWIPETFLWHPHFMVVVRDFPVTSRRLSPKWPCGKVSGEVGVMEFGRNRTIAWAASLRKHLREICVVYAESFLTSYNRL